MSVLIDNFDVFAERLLAHPPALHPVRDRRPAPGHRRGGAADLAGAAAARGSAPRTSRCSATSPLTDRLLLRRVRPAGARLQRRLPQHPGARRRSSPGSTSTCRTSGSRSSRCRSTPARSSARRSAAASTPSPPGQAEAARAIGLTFTQNLRYVVLPQAWKAAIVPLGSVIIAMIKNSALAGFFGARRRPVPDAATTWSPREGDAGHPGVHRHLDRLPDHDHAARPAPRPGRRRRHGGGPSGATACEPSQQRGRSYDVARAACARRRIDR